MYKRVAWWEYGEMLRAFFAFVFLFLKLKNDEGWKDCPVLSNQFFIFYFLTIYYDSNLDILAEANKVIGINLSWFVWNHYS